MFKDRYEQCIVQYFNYLFRLTDKFSAYNDSYRFESKENNIIFFSKFFINP